MFKLTATLSPPNRKVMVGIKYQFFFVYSRVQPRKKYMQLTVKSTTCMFEYLKSCLESVSSTYL